MERAVAQVHTSGYSHLKFSNLRSLIIPLADLVLNSYKEVAGDIEGMKGRLNGR